MSRGEHRDSTDEGRRAAGGTSTVSESGPSPAAPDRSHDPQDDQPLRASWDPASRLDPPQGRSARRGRASRPSRPWTLYAVPLLLVVTVLVVVRVVSPSGIPGTDDTSSVVGEAPVGPSGEVDIPTAELPVGGAFPVAGAGHWHVVPGSGPQVGEGRVYSYTVEVEDGAVLPEGDAAFATAVDATLSDPRSWVGSHQIAMRRVDHGAADFRVSLSSQLTTRRECGYTIRYEASCWKSDIGRVLINGARWVRGAGAFDGQLGLYRQYAINHEVGHVFRNRHVPCPVAGGLAPVMMQQSFGTSNDYLAQLTEENPQGTQIPRDGKTCQPNAWPFPH